MIQILIFSSTQDILERSVVNWVQVSSSKVLAESKYTNNAWKIFRLIMIIVSDESLVLSWEERKLCDKCWTAIQLCWTFLYLSHKEGRWDVWPDWLLLARFILWTLNIFWEIWIFENSQISVRMIADIDSNETKISVNEMNKTSSKFNIDQFFRSRRPISTPPLHFQSFCVFKQEKCDDSFRSKKNDEIWHDFVYYLARKTYHHLIKT